MLTRLLRNYGMSVDKYLREIMKTHILVIIISSNCTFNTVMCAGLEQSGINVADLHVLPRLHIYHF